MSSSSFLLQCNFSAVPASYKLRRDGNEMKKNPGTYKGCIMLDWFNTVVLLGFSAIYFGILGLILLRLWRGRGGQLEA
jgi:hypothetical protein